MVDEPHLAGDDPGDEKGDVALWPLTYRLQALPQPSLVRWWSYQLYQSPEGKKVQVLYSKDKARSEELAKKFLDEPVVGFDMEWPVFPGENPPLQKRIGLIQVACEDTIVLFHIGLHAGKSTDDIIAPSLRKLIESPTIAKTGVGILSADFARLQRFFGLKPQGAFELSHLNRLVQFAYKPHLLNTRMISLADLVENHLGLPLAKGSVRTSNWSRTLNEEQKHYAASDAYAGFMLFHCMNSKRLALRPVPTLPIFAEQYPRKPKGAKGFAPITTLMLHPTEEGGSIVAANEFFRAPKKEADSGERTNEGDTATSATVREGKGKGKAIQSKTKTAEEPLNPVTQILYDQLSERRKALALENGTPVYLIANNSVLRGLAQKSPQNDIELLEIKGIGKTSVAKYGEDWLEVIALHVAVHGVDETIPKPSLVPTSSQRTRTSTPTRNTRRQAKDTQESPDSSPTFGSPIHRTPVLHTGLSFTLSETKLDTGNSADRSPRYPALRRSRVHRQDEDIEVLDLTGDAVSEYTMSGGARFADIRDPLPAVPSGVTPVNGASRWSLQSSITSEDSLDFKTPPSRPPSSLKRKRTETRPDTATPTRPRAQPVPPRRGLQTEHSITPAPASTQPMLLSPRSKIFRNKLVAFSKLVTKKLDVKMGTVPIVSETTLDLIVSISPRTTEELNCIAGIERFACACADAQMDLLRNIVKFAPTRP